LQSYFLIFNIIIINSIMFYIMRILHDLDKCI